MAEKMKQESGDNSQNIQIAGDLNYGITAADAITISHYVVKQELAMYTSEALSTAEERFKTIANKTVDQINAENPNLFPKFKDPAIQVALNETYKKYIETGDDELGDNLINMLIDRLEIENRNTKQFIIDDARIVLPKLSNANLSFLALQVFSLLNIPTNNKNEYKTAIEKLKKITEGAAAISNLDIMYLKQAGCAMGVPMIHVNRNIADSLLNTYEYYFSRGITLEAFNELATKYQLNHSTIINSFGRLLSLTDMYPNNFVGLRFSSRKRFEDFFLANHLPEFKNFFEEFISLQNKANIKDVQAFHLSIDPKWANIFALWDKEIITTLSIMPVGLYIGSIYLGRTLGIKIPQEIFYKEE